MKKKKTLGKNVLLTFRRDVVKLKKEKKRNYRTTKGSQCPPPRQSDNTNFIRFDRPPVFFFWYLLTQRPFTLRLSK